MMAVTESVVMALVHVRWADILLCDVWMAVVRLMSAAE